MSSFMKFCMDHATDTILNVSETEVPDRYKKSVNVLIQLMVNKKDIFDSINVPYVENVFEDDYLDILESNLENGDVPDGIIYALSMGIFEKQPIDLCEDQTAIIKILSTYICIQS